MADIKKEKIAGIDKIKELKKLKKVIKDCAVKNNGYFMISSGAGFVPRDLNFPVGETQLFLGLDVEDVLDFKDIDNADDVKKIKDKDTNIEDITDVDKDKEVKI